MRVRVDDISPTADRRVPGFDVVVRRQRRRDVPFQKSQLRRGLPTMKPVPSGRRNLAARWRQNPLPPFLMENRAVRGLHRDDAGFAIFNVLAFTGCAAKSPVETLGQTGLAGHSARLKKKHLAALGRRFDSAYQNRLPARPSGNTAKILCSAQRKLHWKSVYPWTFCDLPSAGPYAGQRLLLYSLLDYTDSA